MSDWSRRGALRAIATTAAVGLAGCSTVTDGSDDGEYTRRVRDYERRTAQTTESDWLFDPTGDDGEPPQDSVDFEYVTGAEDRESLRFADVAAAATLADFLAATDLSTHSVYLFQHPVDACHDLEVVSVSRGPGDIGVDFCRDLKPADTECDPDTGETVGVALRLPFRGDDINSVSGGFGPCDAADHRLRGPTGGDGA